MPMKNPVHPGDFIRTEIIEPARLSVTAAATVLQVSRPALSSLLNGKADLSGEMALRIEKAFGVSMDTLMRISSRLGIEFTIDIRRAGAPARNVTNNARTRRAVGSLRTGGAEFLVAAG